MFRISSFAYQLNSEIDRINDLLDAKVINDGNSKKKDLLERFWKLDEKERASIYQQITCIPQVLDRVIGKIKPNSPKANSSESDQATSRLTEHTVCSALLAALISELADNGLYYKVFDFLPGTGAEWGKLNRELEGRIASLDYCETDDNAEVFQQIAAQTNSFTNIHQKGNSLTNSFERLLGSAQNQRSLFIADLTRVPRSGDFTKHFKIKQKTGTLLDFFNGRLDPDKKLGQESFFDAPICLFLIPAGEEIAPKYAPDLLVSVPYDGEHHPDSAIGHYLYLRLPHELKAAAGIETGSTRYIDTRGHMACIPATWEKLRTDFVKLLNGEPAEKTHAESIPHSELESRKSGRTARKPHNTATALDLLNTEIEALSHILSKTKELAHKLS